MNLLQKIGLHAMRQFDPETAHGLALKALHSPFAPKAKPDPESLRTEIAGLKLNNPIGLAAGFDKNGEAITPLLQAGFGFIEIGAVTPLPQPGNPKPRLFRLHEDRAVINRFGFNSNGMEDVATRLEANRPKGIIGVNLGANKNSDDRARDYSTVFARLGQYVDFATINVSSPNTENLRDLQGVDALRALIEGVLDTRARNAIHCKIFLKIAPDLARNDVEAIAGLVQDLGLDALVATNTTISRPALKSRYAGETGGLSGAPLKALSTCIIAESYAVLQGRIPIIGVGGIDSPKAAREKLHAGANAFQLYSALVYQGFDLIEDIKKEFAKTDWQREIGARAGRFVR